MRTLPVPSQDPSTNEPTNDSSATLTSDHMKRQYPTAAEQPTVVVVNT